MLEFDKLLKIAAKLRSKTGCPWDQKQTLETVCECVLQESEEVKSAVILKDHKNLREEIGDVLFNLVLLTQIAKEKKLFTIKEVLNDIAQKIICRHTWVFGKDKAKTAEEALSLWHRNKKKEAK